MKRILAGLFLTLCLSFAAAPITDAWSADLRSAKQAGLIGERLDGYLGFVRAAPPDVRALVREVNRKRRARYRQIAAQSGIALHQVELLAGRKAIAKTPSGLFVQSPSGRWVRKP
ncbi:MAG: DUF1318 domain-containing protein [Zetaproteobacteria bacterium]|nr:MAG: DUF1318 domain-containing protein [Zetaproteobacteria bacterium]